MATTSIPYSTSTIEWSPVIAGTIVSCAVSLVLMHFGQALGLSFTNMATTEVITVESILVFGLWLLWVQLSASITGGYLAGRMLGRWNGAHESELRDGAHGLLTWALATVVTAIAVGAAATVAALVPDSVADVETVTTVSEVMAKKMTIISGFGIAAVSIVSATAAYIMATIGGDHRDQKIDTTKHTSFRTKKR